MAETDSAPAEDDERRPRVDDDTQRPSDDGQDQPEESVPRRAQQMAEPDKAELVIEDDKVDKSENKGSDKERELAGDDEQADMVNTMWWKVPCEVHGYQDQLGNTLKFYWQNKFSGEMQWEEPLEPSTLWAPVNGRDMGGSPIYHDQANRSRSEVLGLDYGVMPYTGYDPAVHGDYDPTADYAKWHERKHFEAPFHADPFSPPTMPTANASQVMATNRFTGVVQAGEAASGPERHSDAAKSGRQMGAFFDWEAAANAHDGRSLKAERRAYKVTKGDVKYWKEKKEEKKRKKQLQKYA